MTTAKESHPTGNGMALDKSSADTHSITPLEIARELAQKGYHVFPAKVSRKPNGDKDVKPRVTWGMASTTLPGMIEEWWKRWPAAQVCIDCGKSGIAVVDCDVKRSDGVSAWLDLAPSERGSESLETTSGGRHYFYRQDPSRPPLRNDQDGRIADGVDLRGDGGMVIVHPAGYADVPELPEILELPSIPPIVIERMGGSPAPGFDPDFSPDTTARTGETRAFTLEQARAFTLEQALTPLVNAKPGGINGALNAAACVMSHFGPEFWPREQAEGWLLEAQRRAWVAGGGADDGDVTAALKTIRSGLSQSRDIWRAELTKASPAAESMPDTDDMIELEYQRLKARRAATRRLDEEERAKRVDVEAVNALRAELLTSSRLDEIEDLTPLVDGWLYQDSLARIVGKSGCGKTFVALDVALSVAGKRPWFGWDTNGGPVLYVVAEGARGIRKRIRAWEWQHNSGKPVDDLYVLPRAVQMLEDDYLALISVAREIGAVMVVLDTQARVTVGVDENSATDMGRVVAAADRMRDETGACVVLVHHVGYQGGHARGSTAVYGANQTELSVEREEGMQVTLRTTKQKDHDEREAFMKFVPLMDSLVLANLDSDDRKDSADRRVAQAVDTALAESMPLKEQVFTVLHGLTDGLRDGVTRPDLVLAVNDARRRANLPLYVRTPKRGEQLAVQALNYALKQLETAGEVDRPSTTRYRISRSGCQAYELTYTELDDDIDESDSL